MGIPLGSGVQEVVKNRDNPRHFRKDYCSPLSLRPRRRNAQRAFLGFVFALLCALAVPDASAQPFTERNSAQDFNTLGLVGQNKNPLGICAVEISTNKYILVSDSRDKQIFAYDLNSTNKARVDSHFPPHDSRNDDFTLHPDNQNPVGIWANSTTSNLWVVDAEDKKIYSYSLKLEDVQWAQKDKQETTLITTNALKGTFQTNMQFNLDDENDDPTGLWSDGKTMYVANDGPDKIFAYNLNTLVYNEETQTSTIERDESKEIDLVTKERDVKGQGQGNTFPQGIWSDGETMWVSDFAGNGERYDKKIFAYNLATKTRDESKEFETLRGAGNERPRGLWSDGKTMWVADKIDNKIYAYHGFRKTHDRNPNEDFNGLSAAANHNPRGIWSNETTMWVTDDRHDKLFAYDLATKERAEDKEFTLGTVDKFPQSLWSDGTTMWVAHFQRRRTNMVGEVTQAKESKIYAYKMSDKSHDPSKDFDTLLAAGNENPVGLWSDGTTMWVADSPDGKIYAYKMSDKSRDPSKDFDTLLAAGNTNPKGIWSNDTTMWVADFDDAKIYAYKMSDKSRDPSKDFDTLKDERNEKPFGIWSDNTTTMWVLDSTDDKIYAYNTDVVEARLGRLVVKGLVPSREKEDNPNPREEDFEVKLTPLFNNGTMSYKASVPYATERLTLETKTLRPIDGPPPGGSGGISYSRVGAVSNDDLEDVDDDKDDFQVDLTVGLNSFAITVTNGNTNSLPRSRTYRVDVTREFYTFNDPSKNIDLHADNAEHRGVWANETTIWVADSAFTTAEGKKKLFAYKKSDGTRDDGDNGKDIDLDANNADPQGIWSDGTTMWVSDSTDNKLYAYKLSLEAGETDPRDSGKDIVLAKTTMDKPSDEELNKGEEAAQKVARNEELNETEEAALGVYLKWQTELKNNDNSHPEWIWSDGVTMWVSDSVDNKLYAYDLVAKTYVSAKDVSLAGRASRNTSPTGMWADGASLWIADSDDGKIYAHKINEAGNAIDCWEEVRDFNTLKDAGNINPAAIFSDRSTMYVVDDDDKKIYAYNQPLSTNNKLKSLDLSGVYYHDQDFSQHFSSNETNYTNGVYVIYAAGFTTVAAVAQEADARVEVTKPVGGDADPNAAGYQVALPLGENTDIEITVTAENGAQKKYSVTILQENGGRTPIRDIYNADFHMMNANPAGLFGEDSTIYVADKVQRKIYAYDWTSDELGRDKLEIASSSSFNNLASSNTLPWGIWANSETIWVADNSGDKIYAYNKGGNKDQDTSREIQLTNSALPTGLWSDDETLWVASSTFKEIYAYNMWTTNVPPVWDGSRDTIQDFKFSTLNSAGNKNPLGIWSDGTTMWVANGDIVDDRNIKIYAYNMWTNNPAGNPVWDGSPDSAKDINNLKETLDLKPSSNSKAAEFNGGIWSDGITMWVSVVHKDTRGKRLYAFNLPQTPPPSDDVGTESESEDSTLKALRLSGVTLSPVFSPEKTYYTAQVAHDVASTTVTATPNDSAATVEIYWANQPASRRTANRGAQVTLEEGYNVIVMDVTAENGFVETYFVEVTKAEAPPVSGGPLPVFQSSAVVGGHSTEATASSSTVLEKGKSRLIFAEPLLDGGVRFVFLVPAEELKIKTTTDLLDGNWRPLPEDEFKATRESNVDGQDRLTIILPKAAGKQRFLRLTPQR